MNQQKRALELTVSLMIKVMKRFDGPMQITMGFHLMDFENNHLRPLINRQYTGSREDYHKAVEKLMSHMSHTLNNIYDDNLLAQHETIFLEAYGE